MPPVTKGLLQSLEQHYLKDCLFKLDEALKQEPKVDDDDELTQKINANVPMGSLLGRVLQNHTDIYQKLQEAEQQQSIRKDPTMEFLEELF